MVTVTNNTDTDSIINIASVSNSDYCYPVYVKAGETSFTMFYYNSEEITEDSYITSLGREAIPHEFASKNDFIVTSEGDGSYYMWNVKAASEDLIGKLGVLLQ